MTVAPRSADEQLAAALAGCADEPIRIPGSVQPHGALLALLEPDLVVTVASANTGALLGVEAEALLGRRLAEAWPAVAARVAAAASAPELAEVSPLTLDLPAAGGFDVILHRSGRLLIAEFEPEAGGPAVTAPWFRTVPAAVQRLQAAGSLEELAAALATGVRALTGFDRVMVYRFDADWNGEVIAEDRAERLEPFLGLWFPASDIPPQARELYARQWMRSIPSSTYTPVPLVPPVDPLTGGPLDLSDAVLRSVSPVHLQYLRNMGVTSSMSVSLIDDGKLWGLIACHHTTGPHRPPYGVRLAAEFLGRTASVLLTSRQESGRYEQVIAARSALASLNAGLTSGGAAVDALVGGPVTAAGLIDCGGVVLRVGGRLRTLGDVPHDEDLGDLLRVLAPRPADGPVVTDSLVTLEEGLARLRSVAAGALAVPLAGGAPGDALVWLRPEVLREVNWGGNPYESKVVEQVGDRLSLSPRNSFSQWSQTVRLTCRPWRDFEVEAAQDLARNVSDALLRRVEQDNRFAAALQRTVLLDALPQLPDLAVAARYLPSQQVVGGDWYDLIPLPGGPLAVVVGDVAGHGLAVSSVTAQLRHGLRAYLLRDGDPADALARLNNLVTQLLPAELATVVVAVLDPAAGTLDLSSAGHLPILRFSGAGTGWAGARLGPALGLLPDIAYRTERLTLAPGDGLLFFTDGLIEVRGSSLDDRLALLESLTAKASGADLETVCDQVLGGLPPHGDDATLLALRRR